MKKIIALVLTGAMLCSIPVMADSPTTPAVVQEVVAPVVTPTPEVVEAEVVFPREVVVAAAASNKSIVEYINNAVAELPGLSEVTPIGQGGHVIINGAPSNLVFQLDKPSATLVTEAKSQAEVLGGKVLNVVTTKAAINKFESAVVNFYMKGVKAGQVIEVYQLVNGEWVKLTVAEIREDHVVINMTAHGTLAFIEVPAVTAAQ